MTNHNIPINTLVELKDGGRLFVYSYSFDCDKTPLYNLSYKPIIYDDYLNDEEIKNCFKFDTICGFSEEDLKIINKKFVVKKISNTGNG